MSNTLASIALSNPWTGSPKIYNDRGDEVPTPAVSVKKGGYKVARSPGGGIMATSRTTAAQQRWASKRLK